MSKAQPLSTKKLLHTTEEKLLTTINLVRIHTSRNTIMNLWKVQFQVKRVLLI